MPILTDLSFAASVAVVASMAPWTAPGTRPDASSGFGALDAAVQAEMARTGAPGVALVIVEGDSVLLARGYGVASVETRSPVTADMLFQIGSVTKPLTAAAILSASAEGRLSLETPVGQIVAGLTPCLREPTVGQLLSHAGGLLDEPDEYGPQGEEGLAAYPRTWGAEYCLLPAGRAFSYSNSGFALAGLALQELDQKPFADALRARVLAPLGMIRTTLRPTEAMTWPLAVGHQRRDGDVRVVRPLANDARLWPAGTLYSSAEEMGRFLKALANAGRVDGRPALPSAVVEAMMRPVMPMPTLGSGYGYGLELDRFHGLRRAHHGGTMTGYGAVIAVLPERRVGVAVLANGDGAYLARVADRALELALGDPRSASPRAPGVSPRQPSLTARQLDGYVGSFTNPRRFTVEVVRQGDGLVLRRFGRDFPMRPVDATRFLVDLPAGGEETIAVGLDAQGRAEYLQMNVWALARSPR